MGGDWGGDGERQREEGSNGRGWSSVGIDIEGKVVKTRGDVMSSACVKGKKKRENFGRIDTNKWQRYGQFWSRFDKVVWWNGIVGTGKNGGRHAPCLGIGCYSEEHRDGKENHDGRDQSRRLQDWPKVR
ncbi:hypothetical protein F0562_003733 [Nyssa sinensis]|uniref:Uncharacterized protein n=1 Tax=Nyssa sinensis TaxID=561372 RepID=A0A5J5BWA9_9ASTE|nr:hypothetical protein F0562_003733 [Nyssa sinensis]